MSFPWVAVFWLPLLAAIVLSLLPSIPSFLSVTIPDMLPTYLSLSTFLLLPNFGGVPRRCLPLLLLATAAVTTLLLQYSPRYFWLLHGYTSIAHMLQQQTFFLHALFHVRGWATATSHVDRRLLLTLSLAPILFWHADPNRGFDWFSADDGAEYVEHMFRVPDFLEPVIVVVWGVAAVGAVGRLIVHGDAALTGMFVTVAVSWAVGVDRDTHHAISQLLLNIPHMVPSLVLHVRLQRSVKCVGVCVLIALGEDALWGYVPRRAVYGRWRNSAMMGCLMAPHLLHGLLEVFVTCRGGNKATMAALGVRGAPKGELL